MAWDSFRLEKKLIGDLIDNGMYASRFITLPPNDIYESGYGFYISNKLVDVGGKQGVISLPDGYNVQLQMSPAAREPGKRYKRYKLTGLDIKEAVFFPYAKAQAAEEEAEKQKREEEQTRRDKKTIGKIVYGKYLGNTYGDDGDYYCDCFFYNGKRYYNHKHDKVQNVKVLFALADGVSKYFFDTMLDLIESRLRAVTYLDECINKLKKVSDTDITCLNIVSLLEKERERIVESVRSDLLQKQENTNT